MRANLAYRDLSADEGAAIGGASIPLEAAHLYSELSDCVRANDQEGVRRIFGELVRAGRPISEISGMVETLSRIAQKPAPQANTPPIDTSPQPQPQPETGERVTEEPVTTLAHALDRGLTSPSGEIEATAPASEPDHDGSSPSDWAEPGPGSEPEQRPADAAPRIGHWAAAALDSAAEISRHAAGADGQVQPIGCSALPVVAPPVVGRWTARRKSKARICAAAIVVIAVLATGGFLTMHRVVQETGAGRVLPLDRITITAASPSASGSAASSTTAAHSSDNRSAAVLPPGADVQAKGTDSRPEQPSQSEAMALSSEGSASAETAPAITGAVPARPVAAPTIAALEPPKNAAPEIAAPANSAPPPVAPVATPPEPAPPKEPAGNSVHTAPLLERGDRLFGVGDVASARLFYERAAEAGDAQAALRLGETYDPAFLERAQLRVQGDRSLALSWYRRARELGASEAEILLKGAQTQ